MKKNKLECVGVKTTKEGRYTLTKISLHQLCEAGVDTLDMSKPKGGLTKRELAKLTKIRKMK